MSIGKELFIFKDFDHSLFLTNFTSLRNMNQKVWVYEFYSFGRGFLIYYQYALNLSPRTSGVHKKNFAMHIHYMTKIMWPIFRPYTKEKQNRL